MIYMSWELIREKRAKWKMRTSSTTKEKEQELALIFPALSVIKLQRCSTVLFHFYEIVFTSSGRNSSVFRDL